MDADPSSGGRDGGNLHAIAIMCLASLCFIAMHSCIKTVRGEVPVGVILWSQYAFQIVLLTLVFVPRLSLMVRRELFPLQVLRALTLAAAIGGFFIAVGLMPLADVIAIGFIAPILITILSVVFLGEAVGRMHWIAVLVGFAGVLIIVQPGGDLFRWEATVPMAASLCVAIYQTMTRPISRVVEPAAILYVATLVGLAGTSILVPFDWQMPGLEHAAMLCAAACLGAAAHFLLIKAYQRAEASVVAPFAYSELIWASALGFTVFGDVPAVSTLVGGAVLAGSGLYLLRAAGPRGSPNRRAAEPLRPR